MSIALPRHRSLAGAVIFSLVIGGLTLAPISVANAAQPTTAQKAAIVLGTINTARNQNEISALESSAALTVIAQKYAAASAAKGKLTAAPTVIPADANPESAPPVFVISAATISSKSTADKAYPKLEAAKVLGSSYDFAGIGYATKGSKTFVVALVADYTTAPLETQFATKPYLTGSTTVGGILVARTTFAQEPDSVTYEWIVDGVNVGTDSGHLLPLFPDLYGTRISARITATKAGYAPLTVSSATTPKIGRGSIVTTLTVFGDRNVGRTLETQVISPNFVFAASADVEFQWYRGSSKITGATEANYTQTALDLNKKVWVRATFAGEGLKTLVKSSSKSIVTKNRQIHYTSGVGISWDSESEIAVGSVATVDVGDWLIESEDSLVSPGITLSIQWLLDGKAVKGATSETFTVPASAVTKKLSVRVTGKQSGRVTTVRTSDTSYIAGLDFDTTPTLSVAGDFTKGKTLKATVDGIPAGATVSYKWYSALAIYGIRGATSRSLKLTTEHVNSHLVAVQVTIKRAGYNTITLLQYSTDLGFLGLP
jgi:hypothetical protein